LKLGNTLKEITYFYSKTKFNMSNTIANKLKLTNLKLETILNVTNAINANTSVKELLTIFKDILINELSIGKVSIYRYNGSGWKSMLDYGVKKRFLFATDFVSFDNKSTQIKSTIDIDNTKLKNFDFIIPVYHKQTPLAYVFIGDINEEKFGMSPSVKHLNFIQTLANILMVAIENKRLFRESLQQLTIKKEMELATKMQKMLIPKNEDLPNNNLVKMWAYYEPYFNVGGDYYDYIKLDANSFAFCIADISGKGTSAAILMSNFQANLRALISPEIPLIELITRLNDRIIDLTNNDKFITFFIAKYNTKTKILDYLNCGHIPPIIYQKNTNTFDLLRKGTIGIGMLKKIPKITLGTRILDTNTRIICFTDGITETENYKLKEFGTKPIELELQKKQPLSNTITNIVEKLKKFSGKDALFDDVTLLGVDLE